MNLLRIHLRSDFVFVLLWSSYVFAKQTRHEESRFEARRDTEKNINESKECHTKTLLSQLISGTTGTGTWNRQRNDSTGNTTLNYEDKGGLVWHDLQIATDDHCVLVQRTSGLLKNGALTGLLGPSGSGKSTLLSALAGLCPLKVQGLVQTFSFDESRSETLDATSKVTNVPTFRTDTLVPKQVAWLQQQDDFFTQLTVQETLELAAFMELPGVSASDRHVLVQQTGLQLGLHHAMHRPVGDVSAASSSSSRRGPWFRSSPKKLSSPVVGRGTGGGRLSGGERRRLSVGLELLTSKQLIVADEPTTGLDSTYSATVMKLLKDLAVARHIPALCSLHQPRSSIWNSLDAVILMAPRGRVCYAGPRQEAVAYFEKLGYPLPDRTNPAEHLIDLVSIDSEDATRAIMDEERVEHLAQSFVDFQHQEWAEVAKTHRLNDQTNCPRLDVAKSNPNRWSSTSRQGRSAGLLRWIPRLAALTRRSWRQNIRDISLNQFRLLACAGNAILLSGIFPTVKPGVPPMVNSIADRVALLSFGAINLCMLAYMKAVTLFAQERPVVRREQIREQYSVLEYLVAKVLAELPLDVAFSAIFTTCLKRFSGLQISWRRLTSIFSLLTTAGVSLGYLIGAFAPSEQHASSSGIPVLVILMVVGIINPSGVDLNSPPPLVISFLKQVSPFAFAIEALCLGEYPGVKFSKGVGFFSRLRYAPRMGGLAMVNSGDQVIEALGLKDRTYENAMKHLAALSVMNLCFSWLGLLRQQYRLRVQGNYRKSSGSEKRSRRPMDVSTTRSVDGATILYVPTVRRI